MLLCEEPKELLPLRVHHRLFVCKDLWAVSRWLCKVTKTSSQASADLHCLCVSWEMFTTRQIPKVETGRSVFLPWVELDVKSQCGGTQVSWTDEEAGPCCQSQHVKPCLPMVSWAGCSQRLEKSVLHPSLFLPLRAQE